MRVLSRLRRLRTTNATDSSFASKISTVTKPTGAGVIDLGVTDAVTGQTIGNGVSPGAVKLIPFGTGANDNVMLLRVIAWHRLGGAGQDGKTTIWIPHVVAGLTCTFCTQTGVVGAPLLDTEFLCDTLALEASPAGEPTITADTTRMGTLTIFSPANNTPAFAVVPLYGAALMEIIFDDSTGNPTGMNTLFQFLDGCD